MAWFLTLLTFLAVAAGIGGVFAFWADLGADRARLAERLDEEFRQRPQPERAPLLLKDLAHLAAESGVDRTGRWGRAELWFQQSGLAGGLRRPLTWSAWAVPVFGALGWALGGLNVSGPAALAGALAPWLYVRRRRARRLAQIREQLPDALEEIAGVLRAGHTLPQGMLAVARGGKPPLAAEFAFCYEQQNLGLSPEEAYRELARRTDLLEMKLFAVTTAIQQQGGGNVADILDRIAGMMRDRSRTRMKVQTLTAESRLQATILIGLPPAVFLALLVLRRSYVSILFEHLGLVAGVACWQFIGWLWIRAILNRE